MNRLDKFIEFLERYVEDYSLYDALCMAKYDLKCWDSEQRDIEDQALNDAYDAMGASYGSDE